MSASHANHLRAGMQCFADGDYYHAHDHWEEVWLDEVGDEKTLMKALVQLAVALYHRERGNLAGTRKLLRRCGELLAPLPDRVLQMPVRELAGQALALLQEVDQQADQAEPRWDPALVPDFSPWLREP